MSGRFHAAVWVGLSLFCIQAFSLSTTGGQNGLVRTQSAQTYDQGKLRFDFTARAATDGEYVKGKLNSDKTVTPLSDSTIAVGQNFKRIDEPSFIADGVMHLGIGLMKYWDVSMAFPLYFDRSFNDKQVDNQFGWGDIDLFTKIGQPTIADIFNIGYLLGLTIPTGAKDAGLFPRRRHYVENIPIGSVQSANNHFTSDAMAYRAALLFSLDLTKAQNSLPLRFHLNAGTVITSTADQNLGQLGFGFEVAPDENLLFFLDYYMQPRWAAFTDSEAGILGEPIHISPGMRVQALSGIFFQIAGDFALSSRSAEARTNWVKSNQTYSTLPAPLWAGTFTLGWSGFLTSQDDDRDGLKNNVDRCPRDAEDVDGYKDSDGCPDEDNDSDGIADINDACPDKKEDTDGFEDADGCPDMDNDGDGIEDTQDQCPNIPEDFDGIEDSDGCPDGDNDRDGIPDSTDRCPNDAEDFDTFEDDDGCPDIDNDNDGIPDLKDKCPMESEVFNSVDDEDGCPDTKKKESKMPKHQIMYGISFASGSSTMSYTSHRHLESTIAEMKEYPDIVIEIRGHTDSVGKYESNMRLSQLRAESVRQYIIQQGIAPERIKAVGYGSSSPIADNRTADGRAKNRRIEIVRLK